MAISQVSCLFSMLKIIDSRYKSLFSYASIKRPTPELQSPHIFSRDLTSTRNSDSRDSSELRAPPLSLRFGSRRSTRSMQSNGPRKSVQANSTPASDSDSDVESYETGDEGYATPRSTRSKNDSSGPT